MVLEAWRIGSWGLGVRLWEFGIHIPFEPFNPSTFQPFNLFCLPVPPSIRKSSPWLALKITHALITDKIAENRFVRATLVAIPFYQQSPVGRISERTITITSHGLGLGHRLPPATYCKLCHGCCPSSEPSFAPTELPAFVAVGYYGGVGTKGYAELRQLDEKMLFGLESNGP